MSNIGFPTLNRWFNKKNKDKTTTNGKLLSKSSTNLSISTTNINETSQLEYNRITPLPAATSNAPFEQTFRITVLLPKDQLYVSRLGARVPLSKLLELVCENKLLDAQKYEFRNPVDPSQVYSCDLTIGAVGLSEIRLCHKTDSYDAFNTDEVIKLHRTSAIRDSRSSSELSSRNSKHTMKTASPYSSTNSLNSMDSTGMNYTRTPITLPPATAAPPPSKVITAPPRKKRAAPRPPSQTAIPEKSALDECSAVTLRQQTEVSNNRKHYVSTPNLASASLTVLDCNGNTNQLNQNHNSVAVVNDIESDKSSIDLQVEQNNTRNLYSGSVQNLTHLTVADQRQTHKFPEPSPRKRLIQVKKKSSAPAPPPRGFHLADDSISIASTTLSTPDTPTTSIGEPDITPPSTPTENFTNNNIEKSVTNRSHSPPTPVVRDLNVVAAAAETVSVTATQPLQSSTPTHSAVESVTTVESESHPTPINAPKPVPRLTTTTLLNATHINADNDSDNATAMPTNVSKVMLNRTPTPEPRSLSCEPPQDLHANLKAHLSELEHDHHSNVCDDDNISKQADSGIGEPVPSPIPDSLPSEGSTHDGKSTFESSSDDDDMVKVYNFKLGKTSVKQNADEVIKTHEDLTTSCSDTPVEDATPNYSETASWNFAIPISPPPNFADSAKRVEPFDAEQIPDTPITPKIKQRPVLNFDALSKEGATISTNHRQKLNLETELKAKVQENPKQEKATKAAAQLRNTTPLASPSTPMSDIVDELSTIINEKRIDTLIKKAEDEPDISAAKPNTLTNFSITTIAKQQQQQSNTTQSNDALCNGFTEKHESSASDEQTSRKRSSITATINNEESAAVKQRNLITRADSFHATKVKTATENGNGLNSRSSSQISLAKLEQSSGPTYNGRRSSSELSIGESPSLQSLEVIKTILNSRKNSLANSSSDGESKPTSPDIVQQRNAVKPKNTEANEVSKQEIETPSLQPAKKELPKIYRYSGPPSINFSTWSERPKAQVAIKNEGDYIFGGMQAPASANTMPRNYRASTPAVATKATETTAQDESKAATKPESPIKRMGIPEREFNVPITVRPLQDVTVESVEMRASERSAAESKAKTLPVNGTTQQADAQKITVTSVIAKHNAQSNAAAAQYNSNTATLPRTGGGFAKNRLSAFGPVDGDNAKAAAAAQQRASTVTQLEAHKQRVEPTVVANAAPFGQNTLRKTGLKEKILAKELEAQETSKNVNVPQNGNAFNNNNNNNNNKFKQNSNVTITTNGKPQQQQQQQQIRTIATKSDAAQNFTNNKTGNSLQSAKLELKLQNTTSVFLNQTTTRAIRTPTTTATTTIQSAPQPPPPAPPIAPTLKSITMRAPIATTPTSAAADPRDQLLEAIRSFKRAELNSV